MKRFVLPGSVALLSVLLLGAYVSSIWPQHVASEPVGVATRDISENQSIGGQAASTSESESDDAAPAEDPYEESVKQTESAAAIAPKQAEIKDTTPIEDEYRALRTSNDPLQQPAWVLSSTKAQTAWDTATGNGAVVAVIDTGFALSHEDLTDQWFTNSGETGLTVSGDACWTGVAANKQTNACDDDENGYRDDWRGWDFSSVDNSPQAGSTNPNGAGVAHGTEVAGLVGAAGNNGIGTSTLSWNNTIMPLQALDDDGSGYTSGVAAAVYYAVDNGASVINMSLGGDVDDPTLAQAVRYAYDNDVVVVAAAGNCGSGTEEGCDSTKPGAMSYPALNPHVVAVGATNSSGNRAGFSSYGPGLDVMAPGSGSMVSPMWLSSNQTSAYATTLYGTSFASPLVASYAGLLKSVRPASSVDDITALIDAAASKPSGMNSLAFTDQFGHGIIDAENGLRVAQNLNAAAATTPVLHQTGSSISEHSFALSSTLSSGCEAAANTYCTVHGRESNGYDRFLPYLLTDAGGSAGWTWKGSVFGNGDWDLRARNGDNLSANPYFLLRK